MLIRQNWARAIACSALAWLIGVAACFQPAIAQAAYASGRSAKGPAQPAGPQEKSSGGLKERLDGEVEDHFDDKNIPGLVVLYARDGLLTYKKVMGKADIAANVPMTEHKVGRLNSVSKWVGSLVALRLSEQGQLNLNAKANTYLADLPDHHTYRVIDALTCRSGVRHYGETKSPDSPSGDWAENDYSTATEALPKFWLDPLASPVGEYHYSSFGYTVSDACMESATGQAFSQLLTSVLSTPHGISSLKVEDLADGNPQRMKFYKRQGSANVAITPPKKEWIPSGGGMESTPADLLKLGIRYCDGQVLSATSMQKMQKRIDPLDSYCVGCSHAVENGYHVIAKNGSEDGSNAYIWMVPERRMVMVLMANSDAADIDGLGKKLRKIILSPTSTAGELPDLVVKQFKRTGQPQFKSGTWEVPVSFDVVNQGQVGANESFVNSVRVEANERWSGFMNALPSKGSSKSVAATIKIPDPGKLLAGRTLTFGAYADAPIAAADTSLPAHARVKEENENNNGAQLEVSFPGGIGDLTGGNRPSVERPTSRPPQRPVGETIPDRKPRPIVDPAVRLPQRPQPPQRRTPPTARPMATPTSTNKPTGPKRPSAAAQIPTRVGRLDPAK
jgi:CubicO group peptidase (beta-lactamase class C family)